MEKLRQSGFTLIELMIAVAVIGILAGIALPSYQQYIIRSHRAAAQAQMMDLANREQQLLLANRSYAAYDATACAALLPGEVKAKYGCTLTVGTATVPSYLITFIPTGSQASDGNLTLSSEGVKTPSAKW